MLERGVKRERGRRGERQGDRGEGCRLKEDREEQKQDEDEEEEVREKKPVKATDTARDESVSAGVTLITANSQSLLKTKCSVN